ITLSDFAFVGGNVVPGVNDRVAKVAFRTAASFHGTLQFSVDVDGLILDTPDDTPMTVAGFAEIKSDIAQAVPINVLAVPEPATSLLLFAGMLAFAISLR